MGVLANRSGQYSHSAKACASQAEQDRATDATVNNLHSDDQRAMHASFAFMSHDQGVAAKNGQPCGNFGFRLATLVFRSGEKGLALWIPVIQPAVPDRRLHQEGLGAGTFNPGMYDGERSSGRRSVR
jgi:hypothetical protein